MEHSFDIEIAQKVGVTAAVIYKHICFWVAKNKANNKHFYEGKFWTYHSINAFSDLFNYLTSKQIRTSLEKLEKFGLIVTGHFNGNKTDRTKWYTISDEKDLVFLENIHFEKDIALIFDLVTAIVYQELKENSIKNESNFEIENNNYYFIRESEIKSKMLLTHDSFISILKNLEDEKFIIKIGNIKINGISGFFYTILR